MQTCIGGLPGNKTTCSVRVKILRKRKNIEHKGLKGVDNEQENIFSKSRLKIYLSARARYIAEFGEVCALCSHSPSADLQAIAHLLMNNSDIHIRFVSGTFRGGFLVNLDDPNGCQGSTASEPTTGSPSNILGQSLYRGSDSLALCPAFCCLI